MNIRKNIDYTEMYTALDFAMEAAGKQQMELYCEIGKAVSQRTEKGAAVAAAEYLAKKYPDVQGFSPRNLRRMRDFYRTYKSPELNTLDSRWRRCIRTSFSPKLRRAFRILQSAITTNICITSPNTLTLK